VTVRRSSNYTVHLSVQLTLQTVICASRHSPPPSLVLDYFESSLSVPCQLICVVFLRASAKHFLILEKSCYLHVTIPYDRITIFTQDKKKKQQKNYIGMVTVLECHWKGIWEINKKQFIKYA